MQGQSRIGGAFMHATEGSSSYLSAGMVDVGYRKVIVLEKSDDSRRRNSPSVGVYVVGRQVRNSNWLHKGNVKCKLPLGAVCRG